MSTFYDEIGGSATIRGIVKRFYEGVARTRSSGRSTPSRTSGRRRTGSRCSWSSTGAGPRPTPTSAGTRGCGCGTRRSRSRRTAKDHWLLHFRAALDEADLTPEQDAQFWDYVTHAAQFMVNTMEPL